MKKKLVSVVVAGYVCFFVNCALAGGGTLKSEEQKYLESYGWIVGSQANLVQLGLADAEIEFVISGVRKSANGDKSPSNLQEMSSGMEQYLQQKAEAYQAIRDKKLEKEAMKNKKSAENFYSKLDHNSKVQKTNTGLYYQVITTGDTTDKPKANSVVKIHYVGTLVSGYVFDSSKESGEPVVFSLERVIPGFREGLQFVGKGGTIKLFIPPDLAYGNQDLPGIPPGSTLIFEVDILDVMISEDPDET